MLGQKLQMFAKFDTDRGRDRVPCDNLSSRTSQDGLLFGMVMPEDIMFQNIMLKRIIILD
jgi:hypothetical protein